MYTAYATGVAVSRVRAQNLHAYRTRVHPDHKRGPHLVQSAARVVFWYRQKSFACASHSIDNKILCSGNLTDGANSVRSQAETVVREAHKPTRMSTNAEKLARFNEIRAKKEAAQPQAGTHGS